VETPSRDGGFLVCFAGVAILGKYPKWSIGAKSLSAAGMGFFTGHVSAPTLLRRNGKQFVV